MKTIAAALFVAAAHAGASTPASEICIANDGGFILKWYLKDVKSGEVSESTDKYSRDNTTCMVIDEWMPGVVAN